MPVQADIADTESPGEFGGHRAEDVGRLGAAGHTGGHASQGGLLVGGTVGFPTAFFEFCRPEADLSGQCVRRKREHDEYRSHYQVPDIGNIERADRPPPQTAESQGADNCGHRRQSPIPADGDDEDTKQIHRSEILGGGNLFEPDDGHRLDEQCNARDYDTQPAGCVRGT